VQNQADQSESVAPIKRSSRKSIVVLSVIALAINGTVAFSTLPTSSIELPFTLPSLSTLAELIPHETASDPAPDPVATALNDIQSAQQQHAALQQETTSSLRQNTALLQQDSVMLAGLRQSVSDEQYDIKKISNQLSTLIAKVDSLQSSISPEFTSSVSKARARAKLTSVVRKKMARAAKPTGPISVGGAPLTTSPAQASGSQQSPEG